MKKLRIFVTMDASGSMGYTKKYHSKIYYEKLKNLLSAHYELLDTVFIKHTTTGAISNEKDIFIKGESGGTYLSSGISQIYNLELGDEDKILIMFSDGDNWSEDNETFGEVLSDLKDKFKLMYFVEFRSSTYSAYVTNYIKENYFIENLKFNHITNYCFKESQSDFQLNNLVNIFNDLGII